MPPRRQRDAQAPVNACVERATASKVVATAFSFPPACLVGATDRDALRAGIDDLLAAAAEGDSADITRRIKDLVPEYTTGNNT